MTQDSVIVRKWTAKIRTADEKAFIDYLLVTGIEDAKKTPGNLGDQILMRQLGDGTSEVTTLSWWTDYNAIRAYAGDNPELPLYYPEDDRFLLTRPAEVEHHRVVSGRLPVA